LLFQGEIPGLRGRDSGLKGERFRAQEGEIPAVIHRFSDYLNLIRESILTHSLSLNTLSGRDSG